MATTMSDAITTSEEARLAGNTHYKSGQFERAIELYLQAHELSPESSAPLANLSAAYFEIGDYAKTKLYSESAIRLMSSTDKAQDDAELRSLSRLQLRLAKTLVLLKEYHAAQIVLRTTDKPSPDVGSDWMELATMLTGADAIDSSHAILHDASGIAQVPQFMPIVGKLQQQPILGQDKPSSIFDTSLLDQEQMDLSFLFANAGDARHAFATLIHIAHPAIKKPSGFRVSLTIVDSNPVHTARLLVLLSLLDELAARAGQPNAAATAAALLHIYVAPILPADVYMILQRHISKVIATLDGISTVPSYLSSSQADHAALLSALHSWQNPAAELYPVVDIQTAVVAGLTDLDDETLELFPQRLRQEAKAFRTSGILHVDTEQDLPATAQDLEDDWETNPTLLSRIPAPQESTNENDTPDKTDNLNTVRDQDVLSNMVVNPFTFASHISSKEISSEKGIADIVGAWFQKVAEAMAALKSCLSIQPRISDFRLPRTLHPGLSESSSAPDDGVYDRMHLADLPTSAGGTLFVYMFVAPLLKARTTSYLTWRYTRYSSTRKAWDEEDFRTVGMRSISVPHTKGGTSFAQKIFGVVPDPKAYDEDAIGSYIFEESVRVTGYRRARWAPQAKTYHDQLLPRAQLTLWLQRLLLHITLPVLGQDATEEQRMSPYNLATFVQVVCHLYGIGYPAHWLSEVLTEILTGQIVTTARAPHEAGDSKKAHAEDISFCGPELQTLLSPAQDRLNFGFVYQDCFCRVQLMHVVFRQIKSFESEPSTVSLVLHKVEPNNDDAGAMSRRRQDILQAKIITCIKWNEKTKSATFNISKNTWEALEGAGFHISLWHNTSWTALSESRPLADCTSEDRA